MKHMPRFLLVRHSSQRVCTGLALHLRKLGHLDAHGLELGLELRLARGSLRTTLEPTSELILTHLAELMCGASTLPARTYATYAMEWHEQ
jgi:hypothetical protein